MPQTFSREAHLSLVLRPRNDFIETPAVRDLTERSLAFLEAGFPVHFRGPAGTGKTTLALHLAAQLKRPVMLLTGDAEMVTGDLVGAESGYRYRKVVDRFIQTVLKYEETAQRQWTDQRLTTACRHGYTLIYDEFTRSRPEANNVLLSVLEERVLILPTPNGQESYIRVHPDFRAIFTSNPLEYAGVNTSQDALFDRLVTMDLDYPDRDTEIAICASRSGLSAKAAAPIVDLVRAFRAQGHYDQPPTLRTGVIIGRVTVRQQLTVSYEDLRFVNVCLDVLVSKKLMGPAAQTEREQQRQHLLALIKQYCRSPADISSEATDTPVRTKRLTELVA